MSAFLPFSYRYNGHRGTSYHYTDSLLQMESTSGPLQPSADCNHKSIDCEGFLPLGVWQPYLCSHPNQRFAWLKRGILHGFRIGCCRKSVLRSCLENLQSVFQNAEVVDRYIEMEVKSGKLIPVSLALEQSIHYYSYWYNSKTTSARQVSLDI